MNASSTHLPVAVRIAPPSMRSITVPRPRREREGGGAWVAPIPLTEVRARGFTVVNGDVFDLARFAKHHPGGSFLTGLIGQDATFALANAHAASAPVRKMLMRFYVGPFAEHTREPLERDLATLRDELRREGLFAYGSSRIAFDVLRWIALFAAGAVLHRWSHAASFVVVLAGTIDVVWWIHDAGHDAVLSDERVTRRVIDALGVLVLGMPQQGYHYGVHRIHHGFTNVVGVDRALETGTLSWTEETASAKPAIFRRGRVLQWFLGILPLAGPALLFGAVAYSWRKRQRLLLAALGLRWCVVVAVAVWMGAPELVVAPWVAGSILAFMAGLNHFHLPMTTSPARSYVRAVFERTQNIEKAGRFWHWLSGGLDLHIEHHLFPAIASHRYPELVDRVRALARRHGLPYQATTRWGAVMNLVRTLRKPLAPTAPTTSITFETFAAVTVRVTAILLPAIVAVGVTVGGASAFVGPIVVFGMLSVVEVVLAVSGAGRLSLPGDEDPSVLGLLPRAQLWVYGIGHVLVVPLVLVLVARGGLTVLEIVGAGFSLASMAGTVGGLGGHELMHKRSRVDRALGIAIYATSSYGHFITSHVGGHHVNVGLRKDWGTSRRGESIYGFLYRAVVHGYLGGFRIERARLQRHGRRSWSLGNFVVSHTVVMVGSCALIGALGGVRTLAFFLVTSALSIGFMELFNYISHYALERAEPAAGGRSPIEPEHTWESNNKVVNWFIFNAGMHCHHHAKPAHGFEDLTLFHEKEYIPHGIAMMAILSFIPPLYLRTMERVLARRAQVVGDRVRA